MRGALFWLAFGLLLPQALWTRKTTPRFRGAEGQPQGLITPTAVELGRPTMQLVGLGDSIIAGVGAATQDQTLVVQTTHHLAELLCCSVAWQAHGKIGADAQAIARRASGLNWPSQTNVVIISTGVNDLLGLASIQAWTGRIDALVKAVREHAPTAWIVFCGVPPMHRFPSLPKPLRWVLGWRARHFDEVLSQTVATLPKVISVGIDGDLGPEVFADDGFHPGALGYSQFGQMIAAALEQRIRAS